MLTFLYIFAKLISIFLAVMTYAMLARMLLPLVIDAEDSSIYRFVTALSEPIVAPVRFLLSVFNIGTSIPIDISLPVAYILLFAVRLILPTV